MHPPHPLPLPGRPLVFGAAAPVGPEVSVNTFVEAETLMQVSLSPAERDMAAAAWRVSMTGMLERRTGPRKVALADGLAPATVWNPVLPGVKVVVTQDRFIRSKASPGPLPTGDADIAFAPVTKLSR